LVDQATFTSRSQGILIAQRLKCWSLRLEAATRPTLS
jgi:hypothetical protein